MHSSPQDTQGKGLQYSRLVGSYDYHTQGKWKPATWMMQQSEQSEEGVHFDMERFRDHILTLLYGK